MDGQMNGQRDEGMEGAHGWTDDAQMDGKMDEQMDG